MSHPIPDKAEVVLEYPDKFYIGTFERTSRFEVHLDETGISLTLEHGGDAENRKSIRMHLHYALFSDIISDLAASVPSMPTDDILHKEALRDAVAALHKALAEKNESRRKIAKR